jgi:hypothetical protein
MKQRRKRFQIAFSFAGEKRDYVSRVAGILARRFGRQAILYDKYHEAEFARRDLGIYLPNLYHEESDLIVVVVCPDYEKKEWCGLEWIAIHALLKNRKDDEVMLCRFEYARLKGLFDTAGWLEFDHKARVHCRSAAREVGDSENPLLALDHVDVFSRRVLAFALAYAERSEKDWQQFMKHRIDLERCEAWCRNR